MSLLKKIFLTGTLLATVFVMTVPASAWDGRFWKPYQEQQFGGQRRQVDGVYGGLEAIFWNVNGPRGINSWLPSLDFNTIDSEFQTGTRFCVGNRRGHHGWRLGYYGLTGLGGNLNRPVSLTWEQLPEGSDRITVIDTNGYYVGDQYYYYNDGDVYNDALISGRLDLVMEAVDVKDHTISVSSIMDIANVDLLWTYRAHPFSWGELELYAGAKYWDFHDQLRYNNVSRNNVYRYSFWEGAVIETAASDFNSVIIFGDSNGRFVALELGTDADNNNIIDDNPTPLSLSVARKRSLEVRNRMVGPSFGTTVTRRNKRWTFGADASVFLGVNNQAYTFDEYSEVTFEDNELGRSYGQTGTSGVSQGGTRDPANLSLSDLRGLHLLSSNIDGLDGATYYRRYRTVFSPGVSLQLSAKWQWTDAVGIKLSFDSTIMDNVGRGNDLIATPVYNTSGTRTGYNFSLKSGGDTILLYGVSLGLEVRR